MKKYLFLLLFIFSAMQSSVAQEPPKVYFIIYQLFDEKDIFKEYKTDMLPASVSSETHKRIKKVKVANYKKAATKVSTRSLKLELEERVVIIKLHFKSSNGESDRILIKDFKITDDNYKISTKTIVDEYLASSMIASDYKNFEVLYDGIPFSIPKKNNTSYFDELHKVILKETVPHIEEEDKKEIKEGIKKEKKKATTIGVRG